MNGWMNEESGKKSLSQGVHIKISSALYLKSEYYYLKKCQKIDFFWGWYWFDAGMMKTCFIFYNI